MPTNETPETPKPKAEQIPEPMEPVMPPLFELRVELRDPANQVIGGKYVLHPSDLFGSMRDPKEILLSIFEAISISVVDKAIPNEPTPEPLVGLDKLKLNLTKENRNGELN